MRLIIAGGRAFSDHELFHRAIAAFIQQHGWPTTVLSGCASGADTMGAEWAREESIPLEEYPADWSQGRRAGPERNTRMVQAADALLALPGGRGTADCIRQARAAGLIVVVW